MSHHGLTGTSVGPHTTFCHVKKNCDAAGACAVLVWHDSSLVCVASLVSGRFFGGVSRLGTGCSFSGRLSNYNYVRLNCLKGTHRVIDRAHSEGTRMRGSSRRPVIQHSGFVASAEQSRASTLPVCASGEAAKSARRGRPAL